MAFHVLTNQIVVVEIKNHKLYKIEIEQVIVIKVRVRKLIFKFISFILMQNNNKQNPRIISKKPDGFIFFSVFIPIAFITTIPSEVFLGLSQLWKILLEVIVASVFLITSRKFWLFALKFYSSASS